MNVGHDFADRLGAKEALLRFNYIDNEPEPENGFTKLLHRIGSLNFSFEGDGWGFRTDISAGYGYEDQSDIWGYVLMPFYELTETLELVGRYTHVESKEENDVHFARYERSIDDGRGDRYDEAYLGFNYYWYGHKLKIQNAHPIRRHAGQGRRRRRLPRLVVDDRFSYLLVRRFRNSQPMVQRFRRPFSLWPYMKGFDSYVSRLELQ